MVKAFCGWQIQLWRRKPAESKRAVLAYYDDVLGSIDGK
jgi:hypothetical protein